jgi:hypothetical protein
MDKVMILFLSLNLIIAPSISENSTTAIPLPTSQPTTPPTTELGTTTTTTTTTGAAETTTTDQNDYLVKLALQVGIPTVVTTLTSSTPLEISIGSPLDPAHQVIFDS